jgi:hypothetical protein
MIEMVNISISIHPRAKPISPKYAGDTSSLTIMCGPHPGLRFSLSRHQFACFLTSFTDNAIQVFWQTPKCAYGPSVSPLLPAPLFMQKKLPFLQAEFLKLLQKLCRKNAVLSREDQSYLPTGAERQELLNQLNYRVLVAICRIIQLPLKRLPKPIQEKCLIHII